MDKNITKDILAFWFDQHGFQDWFQKNDDFDTLIRSRFLSLWTQWSREIVVTDIKDPKDALALIILFDQFPRNMFRNRPEAFSTDPLALMLADHLRLELEYDSLDADEYIFACMPYMHSERLSDQNLSVNLFHDTPSHDYALEHRRLIVEFGRFPHRNKLLGRESTPAETEYLQQPGAGF